MEELEVEKEQPVETELIEEEAGCDSLVFTELKDTLELKRYMARKHNWDRTCEPLQNMDQFALEAVQDMDNEPHACEGISETKPEQLSDVEQKPALKVSTKRDNITSCIDLCNL